MRFFFSPKLKTVYSLYLSQRAVFLYLFPMESLRNPTHFQTWGLPKPRPREAVAESREGGEPHCVCVCVCQSVRPPPHPSIPSSIPRPGCRFPAAGSGAYLGHGAGAAELQLPGDPGAGEGKMLRLLHPPPRPSHDRYWIHTCLGWRRDTLTSIFHDCQRSPQQTEPYPQLRQKENNEKPIFRTRTKKPHLCGRRRLGRVRLHTGDGVWHPVRAGRCKRAAPGGCFLSWFFYDRLDFIL